MPGTRRIDAQIAAIAARQHGVVAATQLRAAGIGRTAVSLRVSVGLMRAVFPGVYAVGPSAIQLSGEGFRMAVVLAGGASAALSHQSAATRHRIWRRGDDVVRVMVVGHRRSHRHAKVKAYRACVLEPRDVEILDGIPTTSVARTCCDLGMELTTHQLAHVIHEATFLELLDVSELHATLERIGRSQGSAVVRDAIELHRAGSAGTRSRTEDRFLERILAAGVPAPLVNTRRSTNVRGIEADFVWPQVRAVVEVDGSGHVRPGAAEHDAGRDEVLQRSGWAVLRVPASDVWRRPARMVGQVRRHLGMHV